MLSSAVRLEIAVILAAALHAWLGRGRPGARPWRLLGRGLDTLARTAPMAAATGFLVTFLLALALAGGREPVPRIADEHSYLLAADTFASGRLSNPPPPAWESFETFHVLLQPSYQSKYPPAQGLFLAAGQLLGCPIAGAWLSLALAAAALGWMLRAFVPPRWALVGSLLPVLRLGVLLETDHLFFAYWSTSYWGGGVALLGGSLTLGAAFRLAPGARSVSRNVGHAPGPFHSGGAPAQAGTSPHAPARPASAGRASAGAGETVLLALGLVLLASSRPFEGLLLSVPLLAWVARRTPCRSPRTWLAASLVLLAGAAATARYNQRVTGSALCFPHLVFEATYDGVPNLLGQEIDPTPRPAAFPELVAYRTWRQATYARLSTAAGFLRSRAGSAWRQAWFFLGPALAVGLVAARPRRRLGFPLLLLGAFLAGLSLVAVDPLHAHYAAPAAPIVFLLAVDGLRRLRVLRIAGDPVGRRFVHGLAVAVALSFAVAVLEHAFYPTRRGNGFELDRARIEEELAARGGRHLVLVRYAPEHSIHDEWVYNRADIAAAPVVWARDLGADRNQELIAAFPGRRLWRVDADRRRQPRPGSP